MQTIPEFDVSCYTYKNTWMPFKLFCWLGWKHGNNQESSSTTWPGNVLLRLSSQSIKINNPSQFDNQRKTALRSIFTHFFTHSLSHVNYSFWDSTNVFYIMCFDNKSIISIVLSIISCRVFTQLIKILEDFFKKLLKMFFEFVKFY